MNAGRSLLVLALIAAACRQPGPDTQPGPAQPSRPSPSAAATFVDRVWKVDRSPAVAPGTLYTFRGDGSLVITSPGSKPLIGSWSRSGSGLVMVEESVSYPVDILELTESSFVIRSHNPGGAVEIRLVPADASRSQT